MVAFDRTPNHFWGYNILRQTHMGVASLAREETLYTNIIACVHNAYTMYIYIYILLLVFLPNKGGLKLHLIVTSCFPLGVLGYIEMQPKNTYLYLLLPGEKQQHNIYIYIYVQ